jgi:exoribonuclease II
MWLLIMLINRIQPGDVFEIFLQKRIELCACISLKKNKLHILTENSREMNVPESRIIHVTRKVFAPEQPHSKIVALLKSMSRTRKEIAESIDLQKFWELLDAEGTHLSLEDLAELVFPEGSQASNESALNRAIYADKTYFLHEGESILIQTRESIEKAMIQREKEAREEEEKNSLAMWLTAKLTQQTVQDPPTISRLIDGLKSLAVQESEQPDRGWVKEILKRAKQSSEDVFSLLVKLGVFDRDENLELIKHGFPQNYSHHSLTEIKQMQTLDPVESSTGRIPLQHLACFTIDSSDTRDMDDALSIRETSDGNLEVGVHITDIASCISPGSFLDQEARERSQTLYMPDQTIYMFPTEFSENLASLIPGTDRLAISTLVTFTPEGNMLDYTITPSLVQVHNRYSYEEVEQQINEVPFNQLLAITTQLRQRRLSQGAIAMPRPEMSVHVDAEKQVSIEIRERETASQIIVSELMIHANYLAARTAVETDCPFPYRYQDPPGEDIPVASAGFDPVIAHRQRRLMTRAASSIEPRNHFSLGLPYYTNVTSPLRRYFDLIAQRQLKSIVSDDEPFTPDEISMLLYELDNTVSRTNSIAMERERYWYLKYFHSIRGQKLRAVILDKLPHKFIVWLTDYCINADFPAPFGIPLQVGQSVRVIVEKANPRYGQLKLRLEE